MNKTTMYQQGAGWIVRSWDERVQCYRLSHEVPYWWARSAVGADNCRHGHDGLCQVESHQHLCPENK